MLFIFGGLPGTGKSELAAHIAGTYAAVWLRIDTIEQAMRDVGTTLNGPEGYMVAYALAKDNLRLGLNVVADSVNPIAVTRDAWRAAAVDAGASYCEIEVICSDPEEHQRRVETRATSVPGLQLPAWKAVVEREYENWSTFPIIIDTAGKTPDESKQEITDCIKGILQKNKI